MIIWAIIGIALFILLAPALAIALIFVGVLLLSLILGGGFGLLFWLAACWAGVADPHSLHSAMMWGGPPGVLFIFFIIAVAAA